MWQPTTESQCIKKISINLLYVHLQVAIVALPQAGGKFRTTPHISLWAQAREWQLLRVGFFHGGGLRLSEEQMKHTMLFKASV